MKLEAGECAGTHRENAIRHGGLIDFTAEFPVNQVSDSDRLVWHSVVYDVANAEVPVKGPGFRVCVHHGWDRMCSAVDQCRTGALPVKTSKAALNSSCVPLKVDNLKPAPLVTNR